MKNRRKVEYTVFATAWRAAIRARMTFLRTAGTYFLVVLVALAGFAMSVTPRARTPYGACRVSGSDRQR
ncbi:MAG: hypothetical protein EPN70_01095 [Paraburkholderia sp.]|uniref:hypothetical protein n=1 Tax=Paraburkholderia sp. TaxID=1926495 RepID=UPI0011F71A10|nr:hypothetical protein [Paraburkholderia sp.]TAM08065.1 MAG: hypothetical protein EPN70_01095 [Paraburkholderia sp.]TAM32199.1 MAG: hypothetical protein EPN59_02390 [Paraburkholderia sp.]